MAHKIFGNRFRSRAEPAWHGLGIVFPADEELLPSEAARRVAGDLKFSQEPLTYVWRGQARDSGHCIVLRLPTPEDPNPMELGVTTERWKSEPYPVLASALDRIDPKIYKVESCGILSGGELMFLALRGEDWSVLGRDEIRTYFLANFSQRVGTGHRVLHVTTRVVCSNTNEAAIASSKIDLRITHAADVAQQIGLAGDLLVRFRKAQEETKRIFDVFASTPAPSESVNQILAAAFPEPKPSAQLRLLKNVVGDEGTQAFKQTLDAEALQSLVDAEERYGRAIERTRELREAGVELFEAFQPADLRGTVWAAYNAATEVSDWRGDGKNVAESVLIGSRAAEKVRAFGAAMEVCGIND